MQEAGYKPGYQYPKGRHWTNELKQMIQDTGFKGTWDEAVNTLWNQRTTKLIRRIRRKNEPTKKYNVKSKKQNTKLIYFLTTPQEDPKVEAYRLELIEIMKNFKNQI